MQKYLTRRNIFIALGVIVAIEVIWALWTLFGTSAAIPTLPSPVPSAETQVSKTTISLQSDKTSYKTGEKITVSIILSSEKLSDGADLIINFDPDKLSVENAPGGDPVVFGAIYSEYPSNVLNAKEGRISVSGISTQSGGVLANGLFGAITFRAKSEGLANISLEFSPGSTADSNVTESGTGKDVLEEVENLELTILP